MHGADEFGPAFQRSLCRAALSDGGLRSLVARFTRAGQLGFSDPTAAWAWRVISSVEHPTALQLETEAYRLRSDDPARLGLAHLIGPGDARQDEYVRGQVVEWARRTVFATAFGEARVAWNAGDVSKAYDVMMARLEEMASVRLDDADRGWFFADLQARQERRWATDLTGTFPIGISRLDWAMGGGLRLGELEVPLAYSGVGKTFWVIQRGFLAARARQRVLHFVLEGGRPKTEDRYEARWLGELYTHVKRGGASGEGLDRVRREYAILRDGLVIRGFADKRQWRISYEDILEELADLRRRYGWVPSLVIVDYGDLVWAGGDDEKTRQKNAFQQLKALSERVEGRGHYGYAVCAPSQAQRPKAGADDKPHVLRPRDIADAYDKVRIADAIISLNRTMLEKKHKQARVHLGKYRDEEDGLTVRVQTDYQHGAFCAVGLELDDDGRPKIREQEDDGQAA